MTFEEFFNRATGNDPFPYQSHLATSSVLPSLVSVPTGMGKTAAAILGWLWRRRFGDQEVRRVTPRRLVYCLPMRVLVEQTRECAIKWLHHLDLLDGVARFEQAQTSAERLVSYEPFGGNRDGSKIKVHLLMGGDVDLDWDMFPERDAILVGTQDMLLSRALNRGYAASRARWPLQFGLLHTDCLWVFDEIQLMGSGLATTAQMEAFRSLLPARDAGSAKNRQGCRSVWMSATLDKAWLSTVDFKELLQETPDLKFSFEAEIKAPNLDDKTRKTLEDRWKAKKPLQLTQGKIGEQKSLANQIVREHERNKGRTLVIVNTVGRACELFDAIKAGFDQTLPGKRSKGEAADTAMASLDPRTRLVLLHSRFRPPDRKKHIDTLLADPPPEGTICVSTQVVEAGVDVSSTTMFTELAPWASLVQRFGRCNRTGHDSSARAFLIDLPDFEAFFRRYVDKKPGKGSEVEKRSQIKAKYQEHLRNLSRPYDQKHLTEAQGRIKDLQDVTLSQLPNAELPFEFTHVIRQRDLIDLFDTTPDLAGNDIDIDRFVRQAEDSDVHVFWRDFVDTPNETEDEEVEPAPRREELCPVPLGSDRNPGFRQFVEKHRGKVWRWSFLDKKWERADAGKIVPGQVFLVHADAGGYSPERGWDPVSRSRVAPISPPAGKRSEAPDSTENERLSRTERWRTISDHTEDVFAELDAILKALSLTGPEMDGLRLAVRWHDRGKAHTAFLAKLEPDSLASTEGEKCFLGDQSPAKAPYSAWVRGRNVNANFRRHFRHELASALAVLLSPDSLVPPEQRNLVAYLVAAHHGKVRLSIRSLPNESRPDGNRRFARGVWDDDELPRTVLGGDVIAPAVKLSLEPMELGLCEQEPFVGQPSWAERMIRLREEIGPFCLAYLEAILRAVDMRASAAKGTGAIQ